MDNQAVQSSHINEEVPSVSLPSEEKKYTQRLDWPSLFLRAGLAFVFLFAAFSFSLNPTEGMHYLPQFVASFVPPIVFLTVFGFFEIALALWLIWGRHTKYAGLLAAFTISGITLLNLASFTILFRNVAIISAALALSTLNSTE